MANHPKVANKDNWPPSKALAFFEGGQQKPLILSKMAKIQHYTRARTS